jgi:hypothetical protein
MRIFRRRAPRTESNDAAPHAVVHAHGGVTTVVSAIALLFSAYSLWETSLKRADLSVYATGVVTYERDTLADEYIQPTGGFEVFAVPVTIANSGAQDAAILGLQLDVSNAKTGLSARFEATYTADAGYFANVSASSSARQAKPRTPFSALVIPGRSAWTGTVLFYPVSYSNGKALTPLVKFRDIVDEMRRKSAPTEESRQETGSGVTMTVQKLPDSPELDAYRAKVLNQSDKVEATLNLVRPAASGWLDRVLGTSVKPVALTLDMPDIPGSRVARGEPVRLRTVVGGS